MQHIAKTVKHLYKFTNCARAALRKLIGVELYGVIMSSSKLTISYVLTVSLLTILSQPIRLVYADEPVEETAEIKQENYKPDTEE